MRCEACGGDMIQTNVYKKGRHHKGLFKCLKCGKHMVKNLSLVPNVVRRGLK